MRFVNEITRGKKGDKCTRNSQPNRDELFTRLVSSNGKKNSELTRGWLQFNGGHHNHNSDAGEKKVRRDGQSFD